MVDYDSLKDRGALCVVGGGDVGGGDVGGGWRPERATKNTPHTKKTQTNTQTNKKDVCIVSAVRTPLGAFMGALSGYSATDLGGFAIKGLVLCCWWWCAHVLCFFVCVWGGGQEEEGRRLKPRHDNKPTKTNKKPRSSAPACRATRSKRSFSATS